MPGGVDGKKSEKQVRRCAYCAKRGINMRCSSCKLVYYCGPEHSQLHWPNHRVDCHAASSENNKPEVRKDVLLYIGAQWDTIPIEMACVDRYERHAALEVGLNSHLMDKVQRFVFVERMPRYARRSARSAWDQPSSSSTSDSSSDSETDDDTSHKKISAALSGPSKQAEDASPHDDLNSAYVDADWMRAKIDGRVRSLRNVKNFEDIPSEHRWSWYFDNGTRLDYFHSTNCPVDFTDAANPKLMHALEQVTVLFIRDYMPNPMVLDLLPSLRLAIHNGCYWFVKSVREHYVYTAEYETESDDETNDTLPHWWHQFYTPQSGPK